LIANLKIQKAGLKSHAFVLISVDQRQSAVKTLLI